MNEELKEAKKKLREGVVAFIRAAYKVTGDAVAASVLMAAEFNNIGNDLTKEDFAGLEEGGVTDGN